MKQKTRFRISVFAATLISVALFSGCGKSSQPPDADTVAVFEGGRITRQDVKASLDKIFTAFGKNNEAARQLRNRDSYRKIVEGMVLDRMVIRKITDLKLDNRKNISHVMKHVSEDMNISELHSRAHEQQIKVSDEEIRNRYEQDRTDFGQATLVQATEQIRTQILAEKEKIYFQDYLDTLRLNAAISRNDELLQVPEPNEADLRMYYEQNRAAYPGKPFEEARDAVFEAVRAKDSERWFQEIRNRTLMTIHGKRFTVGEFYDELEELPDAERERYGDFESRKMLLDKLIDRLLLVEDSFDQVLSAETRNETGHIREDILRQILHQEEVDDRIQVSNEEIQDFFQKNSAMFVSSPRVQINYIRIGAGQTDAERSTAEKKVKAAYEKLKPGLFRKGEPFEKVAEEYSEDPETAKNGGALSGWISENNEIFTEIANHGFHENVLGLGEKDISRPFLFRGSYYLVQVRERQEPNPMAFEEAREMIENEIKARKHEQLAEQVESTLLKQANPIIFDKVIDLMLKEDA
jgi:parvulin-like peptidyl-prolyl isomerase